MTALYRLRSTDGALLYIGVAGNPGRRFEQHATDKPWWSEVATITLAHYPDRAAALAAERDAIHAERPRYNIAHNRPGPAPAAGRWRFARQLGGGQITTDLWLYPELDLSSCVDDVYWADGHEQLDYYIDQIQRHHPDWWAADAVPISWFVRGTDGIAEVAPFWPDPIGRKMPGPHEDFLAYFTWPIDATTGARLDWFALPIRPRFEKLADALAWTPAPFQGAAPLRSIWASRNGTPYQLPT